MQTSSPPVITPNRSQSNPDDGITLPRPIQSVGMNLHNVSGTSTGQTLPRERRAPRGTHFCPTIEWVYPHSATIFILHPLCPLFHPLLSEIYPLVTTLIHPYFSTATTILPPIRRLSAASTMFPRKPGILRGVIPDGTTTRKTGSNCSWALVLVLQQNSTEKLNGHWWWCAPAADPHQKISLFDLQQYYSTP